MEYETLLHLKRRRGVNKSCRIIAHGLVGDVPVAFEIFRRPPQRLAELSHGFAEYNWAGLENRMSPLEISPASEDLTQRIIPA